jgi:DNA-binding IclR family transcriptional regulator
MRGEIVDDHTVVGRALAVLDAVTDCGPGATLAELVALTGIPKPTVRRIATTLVARGLLARTAHGYGLGPELRRLGEAASLHREVDYYVAALEELHAAFGGVAWLLAGPGLATAQPVVQVCDSEVAAVARAAWSAAGSTARLANSAGGHLVLAQQPTLLERVIRGGMAPTAPNSPREPRQLYAYVQRAGQDGVATESEQCITGWSCAAALLPAVGTGQPVIVGVSLPTGRASARQLLPPLLRAIQAIEQNCRTATPSTPHTTGGART